MQSSSVESTTDSTVPFFDIDPGQPEYVVPGQIALIELQNCNLGPPYTHPEVDQSSGSRIVQLQCYSSLSPKSDSAHYLDCVSKLYDSYCSPLGPHGNLPTVINCSGWVQAGGLELLVQLVRRLHVSDIVYISDGSGLEEMMGAFAEPCSNKSTRLHTVNSISPRAVLRTAAELRTMQTLSYFHLAEPEAGELRWTDRPLQEMAPTVVHYSGPEQCILAVMILGDEQNPDFFETILEGCLVDIVVIENDLALPDFEDAYDGNESQKSEDHGDTPEHLYHPSVRRSRTLIPYVPAKSHTVRPLPPKYTHSVGQALIRSIDTKEHQFHLLMPVHFVMPRIRQHLKQKIVLVRGELDTPVWAYKEPIERDKARRRRREKYRGTKEEGVNSEGIKPFPQEAPWVSLVEGRRSAGSKKRSGRRDLRYRSQAKGE